jgi:hypothetical protein
MHLRWAVWAVKIVILHKVTCYLNKMLNCKIGLREGDPEWLEGNLIHCSHPTFFTSTPSPGKSGY